MRLPTAGPRKRNWSPSGAATPPPRRCPKAEMQQSASRTKERSRKGRRMIVYDTRTPLPDSYTCSVRSTIFCAWLAAFAATAVGENSLSQDMLAAHNAVRATVNVPPIIWSDKLAISAQEWANTLIEKKDFRHRQKSKFGENLYQIEGANAT